VVTKVPDGACGLADYYAQRAAEYDDVYRKPERQADLARLRELLPPLVAGRRVLEVAAGTGYWTRLLATTAAGITATDINAETLAIAAQREYSPAPVCEPPTPTGSMPSLASSTWCSADSGGRI